MAKPRPSRARWVWVYVLALTALAAVAHVLWVADAAPLATPHLSWWMLALGFVGAERCIVHLEFHRSAHTISLADLPFVFGLDLRRRQRPGARRVDRQHRRLRRAAAAAAGQDRLQRRAAVGRGRRRGRHRAPDRAGAAGSGPTPGSACTPATLVSGAVTVVADHPDRDRDHRGRRRRLDAAPDVRDGLRRHADQHEPRARGRDRRLHRRARDAAAARPRAHRLPRLPRLRCRAPAPRAAGVPLRGHPHAVALARGRRGARGPAGALARGVPRRDGRDRAVQLRRAPRCAPRSAPATTAR